MAAYKLNEQITMIEKINEENKSAPVLKKFAPVLIYFRREQMIIGTGAK